MSTKLRAPFPYFGYKGKVSAEVWRRLGNPPNYVEPFFGSGAVLLQRPEPGKREVVNDKYGLIANFWRAVKADPGEVCEYAIYPSSESDLHARNAFCRASLPELTSKLEGNPEYHDSKLAGYWVYVQCMAIGEAAFARGPWVSIDGRLVATGSQGGVRRTVPCNMDRGIQRSIPFHGEQGVRKGPPDKNLQGLMRENVSAREWISSLSDRLDRVRILCGDWSRSVKPTYTTQHGLTGVFLDPPYDTEYKTYSNSDPMMESVCSWCAENGKDKQFRIALCGYEGTLPLDLLALGWSEYAWRSDGGRVTVGGRSDANRDLERIWFSPHCLDSLGDALQLDLLEGATS